VKSRRVYVIWKHPIFRKSVHLLLDHPEVEWVGASSDCTQARTEIVGLQPDTILVEESEGKVSTDAMGILETSTWNVRVVSVSLADNRLNIFHREQKTVGQAKDLLYLVLGE